MTVHRPTLTRRGFLRGAVASFGGAATACAGRATRSPALPAEAVDWATPLLGAPPEMTLVLRQPRGEEFTTPLPYFVGWGSWVIVNCRQADFYAGPSSVAPIAVLHGVPPWLDPLRPYPPPPPPRPVPPGADPLAFNPPPPEPYRPYGQVGEARVFTVPESERASMLLVARPDVWIFASGIVADRVRGAFARGVGIPAPLPAMPGSVSDAWMAQRAVFSHSLRAVVMGPCVSWLRDYERAISVEVAVYPGSPTRYRLGVVYPSAAQAQAAADDAQALIGSGGVQRRIACARDIVAARAEGSVLVLDATSRMV